MLLHRKENTKKNIYSFLVLSSLSFRGLDSLIVSLKYCLYVEQINTLKKNVFIPLSQLHICFHSKFLFHAV